MSFNLSEFLTEGLINSVNNGLIPSDLATVYAGNYLVKSLITQTQVTQVSDAITAYKAAQVSESPATSEKQAPEVTEKVAEPTEAPHVDATTDDTAETK